MTNLDWMAWTWQTGLFFGGILTALTVLTFLALRFPETERFGILRIPTTRGDRLFLSLLGSAFIHVFWIAIAGPDQLWGASILSLFYAVVVFRTV
jgi:predicted small integral membrane protein